MTMDELQEYLDEAIRSWRKNKSKAKTDEDILIATCYIDAFQSVRVSVFGSTLPFVAGCPFPYECNERSSCVTRCNANVCSNGYCYRMS